MQTILYYALFMWPSHFSCVQLFVTLWTVAHEAPLSMGFIQARILEWVVIPFFGGLPNTGIELTSLTSPALAGSFFNTSATGEAHAFYT